MTPESQGDFCICKVGSTGKELGAELAQLTFLRVISAAGVTQDVYVPEHTYTGGGSRQ